MSSTSSVRRTVGSVGVFLGAWLLGFSPASSPGRHSGEASAGFHLVEQASADAPTCGERCDQVDQLCSGQCAKKEEPCFKACNLTEEQAKKHRTLDDNKCMGKCTEKLVVCINKCHVVRSACRGRCTS